MKKLKDGQMIIIGQWVDFTCCDCGLKHRFYFDGMAFRVKRLNHFKGLPKKLAKNK